MADTKQCVRWSLAQSCPLRRADEWENLALDQAGQYSEYRDGHDKIKGVWDGRCVTGVTYGRRWTKDNDVPLPHRGFHIESTFAGCGGSAGLTRMCRECPANAALEGLAGCADAFYFSPYNDEFDDKLRSLLQELDLESAHEAAFPKTELLWFGFWIESPIPETALMVLHPLFEALLERELQVPEREHQRVKVETFLRAMERALYYNIPLQVEIAPPGHYDFGYRTKYSHCPRCKCYAPPGSPDEEAIRSVSCPMCYHEYDPTLTYSMQLEQDEESPEFRESMDDGDYRSFAINYLVSRGHWRPMVEEAVERFLNPPPPTPEELEAQRRREQRDLERCRFIREIIFAGCTRVCSNVPWSAARVVHFRLTAQEVPTILARCRNWNLEVRTIWHHETLEANGTAFEKCEPDEDPNDALARLTRRGKDSYFSLRLTVPNAVLQDWTDSRDVPPT